MISSDSFSRSVSLEVKNALRLYFEPLSWVFNFVRATLRRISATFSKPRSILAPRLRVRELLGNLELDFSKSDTKPAEVLAYWALASIASAKRDFRTAEQALRYALHRSGEMGDALTITELSLDLARTYARAARFEEAKALLEKVVAAVGPTGNPRLLAVVFFNRALIHQAGGAFDEAKDQYMKTLELVRQDSDDAILSSVYSNLATLYLDREDWKTASNYQQRAIEIDQILGRERELAEDYTRLALIISFMGQNSRAQELIMKAAELSRKSGRDLLEPIPTLPSEE